MTSPSQRQTQPQGTRRPPPKAVAPVAPPVAPVAAVLPGAALAAGGTALIASITAVLASTYGAAAISALIVARLVKWGILLAVARWVVDQSGRRPGGIPASIGVASQAVRRAELGYRASYIVHACARLMESLSKGEDFDQALSDERRYHRQHMDAIQHRAHAARGVDRAAATHGPLLGWYDEFDDRTTPFCRKAGGTNFAVSDPPWGRYPGTVHSKCVPGSTRVRAAGAVESGTERQYVGEMVTIETALGHKLSATPNHPIATPTGWAPIGSLHKGSHIISSLGPEWVASRMDPYVNDVPSTIQEIFQALPMALAAVPTTPEDFHGDGAASQVHVVRADGLLLYYGAAASAEQPRKGVLHGRDSEPQALSRERAGELLGVGQVAAPESRVGRLSESPSLGGPDEGHAEPHGGPSAARGDVGFQEHSPDRRPSDAEGFCQSLLALSSEIASDEVVAVRRYPFVGHVYNLDTREGWYIGNGIVTHNCRCWAGPPFPGGKSTVVATRGVTE